MAIHESINGATIRQLEIILQSIGRGAETIQSLAAQQVIDGSDFEESKAIAINELAGQLGWLSDLAAGKLGSHGLGGDAESWMLPPAYHKAASSQSEA